MAAKPPVACRKCFAATTAPVRGYCPKCANENPPSKPQFAGRRFKAEKDAIDALYDNAPWRHFRDAIKSQNPRCQAIYDGVQCQQASQCVHHLISPHQDLSKMRDAGNVVAICNDCHDNSEGERPDSNRTFVPTRWRPAPFLPYEEHKHNRPTPLKQGETRINADGTVTIG